jgi:uncharacterized protein
MTSTSAVTKQAVTKQPESDSRGPAPSDSGALEADVELGNIRIEVALALPDRQFVADIKVPPGTTCRQAVALSKIAELFPQVDTVAATLGIYGETCADNREVEEWDRVEIYRPLIHDPREQRRARLARTKESITK